MAEPLQAAQLVVAAGAYLRGAMVLLLAVRTFLRRRHFTSLRIDRGFLLTAPEPVLLIAVTHVLQTGAADSSGATPFALAAAFSGAALVLVGWFLVLWTFASWPSIFVGHAVLRDHHLVTHGAYGFVRHPVYLGAFLIWLGVGVGFASGRALLVAVLYVIPAYLLYIGDEEAMLEEAFGDAYRRYRESVPRLIPYLRRGPVATSGPG
jgi:protein-S-isoprenylcysteine O-methyltransferase Ste14